MNESEADEGLYNGAVSQLASVPFAQLLGISVVGIRRGEAVLALEVREEFKQNHGVVHGGVTASLAAALAVSTGLEAGETTTTIDLTLHYLRPIRAGRMEAKASILREGRNVVVIAIEVEQPGSQMIAKAMAAFLRSRRIAE